MLRQQIDELRDQLEVSRKSIGLNEDHFRSAISCALTLVGSEPLQPIRSNGDTDGPPRFAFPAVHERQGADPTWSDTMDTLRIPRQREQRFWEWRQTSPLRPVVFEDPGTMDDEVVHMHLEQRVVQRLLGRFIAQGFVHQDLSRACLAQASDSIPRVILLGRLCLYGPGATRLHEELLPVTARWVDPQIRKETLSPYAREAEARTLNLLDQSLLHARQRIVSPEIMRQLQASAPRDVQELLPHLHERGEEYARDAEKKLTQRSQSEAKAMREILEAQKKQIEKTVEKDQKLDDLQYKFAFTQEEIRQVEANRRHWSKRLDELRQELDNEPERIRNLYEVKAKRIEPVGLVYLWPVTG
jgi:hypothetical protein